MPVRRSPHPPRRAGAGALAALVASIACASLACAPAPARAPSIAPAPLRSLRIPDGDLDRAPRTVSAAEALRDLDDARYAFEHAYAGLDGRSPSPAPSAIDRARGALRGRAAWRPDALARLLYDVFAAPDGHVAFGHGGRAPLRWEAAPQPPLPGPAPLLFASATRPSPPAAAPLMDGAPVMNGFMNGAPLVDLPLPAAPARRLIPPVELTRSADGVPVLAIRTFSSAAAAALASLPALAAELRRAPAFVVDLRGNAGGDYRFAERFALALTDAPLRALDAREVISVAAAEGRANSVRRRLARGDVPEEARPRFLEHLAAMERLAAALRARPSAAPRTEIITRGALVRGRASAPRGAGSARGVFLVDRGCASACEMLLALVRQIPGVLVAGQNTRGGMSVGEVALFRLPRSGVTISFGTRAFRDPLGDFVELRGFEPDIRLDGADPAGDAVALALRGWPAGARRRGAPSSCALR
ncbi:S41 family peptidase [Sorangium sp. So ce315]|uniref:S41 family peptidase n=1 Tax=Sorangium sp. So ce315 TaxID=3133299 RepID=UPI003F6089D8